MTISRNKIMVKEYKCEFDHYCGTYNNPWYSKTKGSDDKRVNWESEYLTLNRFRAWRISDECPYKLEHKVMGQDDVK